jgi:hypothetical protein
LVLILCVCLQGLLFAPVFQGMTMLMVEVLEAEIDQLEFEEDLLFATLGGVMSLHPLLSNPGKKYLGLDSASLIPDFPPPR